MFLESVPDSHVRLFRREIIDFMTHEHFCSLLEYTNPIQREKLDSVEWNLAKGVLFKCVAYSNQPEVMVLLREILSRKRKVPKDIRIKLNLERLSTHEFYAKLLFNEPDNDPFKMDRIAEVLEPEPIVAYLQERNCREYDDLIERVRMYLEMHEIEDAACELLRGLPYCSDSVKSSRRAGDWYYDFLEACLTSGYTRMIPKSIDPSYEDDLEYFRAAKTEENKKTMIFDADVIVADEAPTEPRPQSDYVALRGTSTDIVYQAADYQLRPYQNELVAHAKKGRNTIICAPTGCGKTLVATDIILNHLRTARDQGRIARALMLVPTVPLVDQQSVEFVRYMAGEFWVDGFSGAESLTDRVGHLLASDVCVVTPQVVINMLNSILKHEKLYFTDITLLIFDECHNCNEEHPYKILMDMLSKADIPHKPQVVGLTASLGVGQTSWDLNACREHMLKMCSNLMADSISTVRHQLDNLKSHVMPPVDVVMRAVRPGSDEFNSLIKETMLKIQQYMKPTLEKVVNEQLIIIKKEDVVFPDHQYTTRYQNVVGMLRKLVQRLLDPQIRLVLVRCIDHLSHYFHAIGISDLLPNRYALMYLDAKMSLYSTSANVTDVNNFLLECYDGIRKRLKQLAKKKGEEEKDILSKLHTILHNQYAEKPESRTLIFVATRACAQRLSEHLNEYLATCENLSVFYGRRNTTGFMTSTNQSAGAGGQSSELQRMMRDKFERGELKVLVVTSVADEGINIMECNLIIKYNTVGSERTLIQRRGRARAKDSKAILLALDGSVELQELENMKKEAMMIACINDLQAHRDKVLQKMIAEKTQQLRQMSEEKSRLHQEQYERLSIRKYVLKCRVCSSKICDSMDVRSVTNSLFVCCDPTVWMRSENRIIKRPTVWFFTIRQFKDGLTTKCARWLCKQCQEEWGIVVKYSSVFMPMVNAKAFVMERLDVSEEHRVTNSANVKTWAQIQREYFNVDPITTENIKEMLYALARNSQEDQKTMEQQEQLANQLALEKRLEKKVKQRVFLEE